MRPTDDQLRRFLAGTLPDAEAESVGRWVESDPSAPSILARLESADSLADALAEPSTRDDHTTPAGTPRPDSPPTLPDGYRLLAELGRGGMGVVYRAVDAETDREVAVKVLGPHIRVGSGPEARFRDEARITAQLQHPGIPPVYRVGTLPDGRPFLAMKLIKGRTLDKLLKDRDDHRADISRWLGVFEGVCQAVGYAHAHGVIHRDLKPSNVMVGSFGEVQVMDWGLAKVLDWNRDRQGAGGADATRPTEIRSLRGTDTHAGSVMGTPAFMAPEQAMGAADRLDRRTDVFGLGAILAVILTDRPPYSGGDTESVRQLAALAKLGDCFARLDGCGAEAELVALCKTCLSAEPDDRPADGQAVAEAVHRLRAAADERARRAEIDRERAEVSAAEQRERQRVLLWAAGAVAGVLLLGLIGTGVGLAIADANWRAAEQARGRERERAIEAEKAREGEKARADGEAEQARLKEEQRQIAESAEALAETRRQEAVRAKGLAEDRRKEAEESNNVLWQGLDTMTALLVGDTLARQKVISPEQKAFLTNVLPLYRTLAAKTGDDEKTRVRYARAVMRVGGIEDRLGRLTEAVAAFRVAADAFAKLSADFPSSPDHRMLCAACHHHTGLALLDLGRPAEAVDEQDKALALWVKVVDDFPAAVEAHSGLAKCHASLGYVLLTLGKRAEAEAHCQKALALREKLVAEFPASEEYRTSLAVCHTLYASILAEKGEQAAAAEQDRKALALREKLAADFTDPPEYRLDLAGSLTNVGTIQSEQGQANEGIEQFTRGLKEYATVVTDFPDVPAYRAEMASGHNNLGMILAGLGKWPEGEAEYKKCLALREKLAADFPTVPEYRHGLGRVRSNMGNLQAQVGKLAAAERTFDEGVRVLEKLATDFPDVPAYRWDLARGQGNLAMVLAELGKTDEAIKVYRRCLAANEKLTKDHPENLAYAQGLGTTHNNLGTLLSDLGQRADAEKEYKAGLTVRENLVAAVPKSLAFRVDLGGSYCNLGNLVREGGKAADSLKWYDKAVDTLGPIVEKEPRAVVARQFLRNSHWGRAQARDQLEKYADAEKDWDQAVELSPPAVRPEIRARRAMSRLMAGKTDEAVEEAGAVRKGANLPMPTLFHLARFYAVASAKVPDEKQAYGDRSLELLAKAVKAGFRNPAELKADKAFDPLRSRDDFKALLAEVEKK